MTSSTEAPDESLDATAGDTSASDGSGGEAAGKRPVSSAAGSLWGGRFERGMAPAMIPLNRSLDLDQRFWRHDVRGSRAWAKALAGAGVLSSDEAEALLSGLEAVGRRLEETDFSVLPDEDVHSLVERLLHEEVGEVAGKLHTGRSRNDQVATDVRLWGMEAAEAVESELRSLCSALVELAAGSLDVILPGYTHMQQAQPIRAAHWALSHFWAFQGDLTRVRRAGRAAGVLPLGSGALAGCPFAVDREALRRELGFDSVSENSLHAVADRDWMLDLAYAGAVVGVHLSRLAEDLVLLGSLELGVFRLGDGFSTGSSLMPQKRNPDVAELARGKAGRLTGNLVSLLTLLKGLPTGYNRDLQEDKPALFDTVDTLLLVLPAMAGAVDSGQFVPEAAERIMDSQLLATDLADYLVRKGVAFRKSHEVVGRLVREAEERGVDLAELPEPVYREAHDAFESDVLDVFSWERSVDARSTVGGTARSAVEAQLERAREAMRSPAGEDVKGDV